MKTALSTLLIAIICALSLSAQTPDTSTLPENYATAGVFYNTYTQPHVTGFGAYAKHVGTGGTYSFSSIDITSQSIKPFRPQTSTTSGVAQLITQFGGVNVFAIATGGITAAGSATGTDLGFAGSGGFMLVKPLSKGWTVNVPIRVLASTVGPPQYTLGIGFGWGK